MSQKKLPPADIKNALLSSGFFFAKGAGILYVWTRYDGAYRPAEEILRADLADRLGPEWTSGKAAEVVKYCYDSTLSLWDAPPKDRLNVLNGIINLETGQLEPHSHQYLSPVQIQAWFNPEADCPAIRQFISEVFPADVEALAYEIAGWLCFPDMSLQKAILLTGEGGNGKSTYLSLLESLLGAVNVSHVSLHDLGGDRFAAADLYGKLANICPDLQSGRLESTALFKAIVGGDTIRGQHKYGHPFNFRPSARLIYSANEIPGSPDSSYAYQRRWVVVPFPNSFDGQRDDKHLLEKLTALQELSGFLNVSLVAYAKVRERGSFTTGESLVTGAERLRAAVDPVADFLAECVVIDPSQSMPKPQLYKGYEEWAKESGRGTLSRQRFNRQLHNSVPGLGEKTINGTDQWVGIGFVQRPINFISTVG